MTNETLTTAQYQNGYIINVLRGSFPTAFGPYEYCIEVFNMDGTPYMQSKVNSVKHLREEIKSLAKMDPAMCWVQDAPKKVA